MNVGGLVSLVIIYVLIIFILVIILIILIFLQDYTYNGEQEILTKINYFQPTLCIDKNLYIAIFTTNTITISEAIKNINFSIPPKFTDIVFLFQVIPLNKTFPIYNLDNSSLYNQTEIPGYISYSTYNINESYIGASQDSIFIYDSQSKNEIYDKFIDGNGFLTCISVILTSGQFNNCRLRLISIIQKYDGYESINSFINICYLFNYIMEQFTKDLFIIGGNFNIRNELIHLAMNRTKLSTVANLFPSNNIVTGNDINGYSNSNGIIIDNRLIRISTGVKINTYSPWLYENKSHYILLITLENFKDSDYEQQKEKSRLLWINKNYNSDTYKIPYELKNIEIEERNIRDNPPKFLA
ncbi:hypothetical protein [Alphaentomopoxvirus acuprea]|uniref:Uncharacterized protein n=1 Tax=Alphaentomopoxvirus acuprea TaxID=62099 RepID=W6JPM1_9POXV|nr:hypothetical protein BA82_gp159 [Anomala cuprea entomopoxvirus]BAO49519.1 hypothetical protein [Anomala cuprea entomopoxvirus]